MGTQINFYMSPDDEAEFLAYLRSQEGVQILKDWTSTATPIRLKDLPEPGTHAWFQVWLWNDRISPPPALRLVEKQACYCIDAGSQEVIEFDRSVKDGDRLVRGRLWAEFVSWDRSEPDVMGQKSDAFKKWFNRLSGWIRRRSERNAMGDYVMRGARRFIEAGGVLAQAVFSDGSAIEG